MYHKELSLKDHGIKPKEWPITLGPNEMSALPIVYSFNFPTNLKYFLKLDSKSQSLYDPWECRWLGY